MLYYLSLAASVRYFSSILTFRINEKSLKLNIFIGMFGRKCLEENVSNVYVF